MFAVDSQQSQIRLQLLVLLSDMENSSGNPCLGHLRMPIFAVREPDLRLGSQVL